MPCSYQESEREIEARRQARTKEELEKATLPLRIKLDELTHENDILREIALHVHNHGLYQLPADLANKISANQEAHRAEDLRRLEKTFNDKLLRLAKSGESPNRTKFLIETANLLLKVQTADPKKPLADQLGFDPDDY